MIDAYWQRTQKEFPALLFRCFPEWDVEYFRQCLTSNLYFQQV